MEHYIDRTQFPELWNVARSIGYKGNKLKVKPFSPRQITSYWDSGSRDYYTFVNLVTGKQVDVPQNGTVFDGKGYEISDLPTNVVMVEETIFRGKNLGITLHVRSDQIAPMLEHNKTELTDDESTVLDYTATLKSSYAGIKNYRFVEANRGTGITLERWEAAKQALIDKKLLNKRGAITPQGRNARTRHKNN